MLDYITIAIAGLNNPLLTFISSIIHNEIIFGLFLIIAVLIGERRLEKIKKIVIAVLLTFMIAGISKEIFKIQRPCNQEHTQKIQCPNDYSFPSSHAALAFTVAVAFLNKKSYIFYLLFAIFVAFTRVYLSVHSFADVSGAVAFAGISYYMVDLVVGENYGKTGST